jgi:hypothetical protein
MSFIDGVELDMYGTVVGFHPTFFLQQLYSTGEFKTGKQLSSKICGSVCVWCVSGGGGVLFTSVCSCFLFACVGLI